MLSIKLIAVPVISEKAFEIGPTPAYKKINKLINAIGNPKEKRFNEGAERVITPIEPCIKRSPPTTGRLIRAAR